jgi:hypothetical protein
MAFYPASPHLRPAIDQAQAEKMALSTAPPGQTGQPLAVRGAYLVTWSSEADPTAQPDLAWVVDMTPSQPFFGASGPGRALWYWAVVDISHDNVGVWFSGAGCSVCNNK